MVISFCNAWIGSSQTLNGQIFFFQTLRSLTFLVCTLTTELTLDTDPIVCNRPKLFRLEKMLLMHPSCDTLVHSHWPTSNPNYLSNMHALTNAIIHWNKYTFGNIFCQKKIILARLKGIQIRYPPLLSSSKNLCNKNIKIVL